MENVASESVSPTEPSEAPIPEASERVEAETYPLFSEESEVDSSEVSGESESLHDVVVFGEKKQVPYKDLISVYQKNEAGDKKLKEASSRDKEYLATQQENEELRRSTAELLDQLKNDPWSVLGHESLGHDLNQLAYDKTSEQMAYEEMDEQERENLELKTRLQAYEEVEAKAKNTAEQENRLRQKELYTNNIKAAFKEGGIDATDNLVKIAAAHLHHSAKDGKSTMTWREMVNASIDTVKRDNQTLYTGMPAEQIANLLGPEILNSAKKHDIQKVKNNFKLNQPDVQPENVVRKPKRQMSKDEFRERMLKIKQSLA